jgi:PAS domain S-box-containing protein
MKSNDFPDIVNSFHEASNEFLAAVLDQSADCIKVIGPTGTLDYMNRNGRCAMEIDDFCAVAGKSWWDLWPEETAHLVRGAFDGALAGETRRFEAFCPTAKGTPRWWDVSVSPMYDGDGQLQGLISTSRDITERIHKHEFRAAMSEEMRHRLQNAYALTGAIIMAAAKGSPERHAFAGEILERLRRLGIAQSLLLEPDQIGKTGIEPLVRRLTEPFCTDACSLQIGGLPDVELDEQQVRTLALVIGELSTNSTKYGALGHGGTIAIDGAIDAGVLALNWAETSDSPVGATQREGGAGFSLIRRALAAQRGSIAIDWRSDGLDVAVKVPLASV